MSDSPEGTDRPTDAVGRVLYRLSMLLALFGGLVVGVMATVILANVAGRAFFSASIQGNVELVELGTSTAVFAFLPYCQLMRSNVIVDFVMSTAPTRAKTFMDAIGSLMFLVLGIVLTWRLILGGVDMYKYNELTSTLSFPRWISFPYAALCLTLLIAVIVYTLGRSIAETRAGRFFDESLNQGTVDINRID